MKINCKAVVLLIIILIAVLPALGSYVNIKCDQSSHVADTGEITAVKIPCIGVDKDGKFALFVLEIKTDCTGEDCDKGFSLSKISGTLSQDQLIDTVNTQTPTSTCTSQFDYTIPEVIQLYIWDVMSINDGIWKIYPF